MPTSPTAICRQALRLIGCQPITDINEVSDRADLCREFYEETRDEVLALHPWTFATKRDTLAQLADAPSWGFDHAYQLPSDTLRVLEIQGRSRFKREGLLILTNRDEVNVRYIRREEDPTKFTKGFVQALTHRLASKLAFPLTKSLEVTKLSYELYQDILSDAQSLDSQEGTPDTIESFELVNPRLE